MPVERTLSIIKPDAVAKKVIGKINSRFETNGLAIVATCPRKFTIVNVVGSIDVEKLAEVEGRFGIPEHAL